MNILFILPPHPFPLTNNLCPISITFPRSLLQFRSRPCFTPRLTSTISSSRFPFSPSPQNLDRSRPPQKHSKKNYSIKFVSYVATSSSFSGSIASLKARLAPYSRTFFPFVYSRLDSPAPQDPRLLSHTVAPQTRLSNVGTTHFRSALPITPVSPQSFGRQAASPSPSRPIPCSRHLPPPAIVPRLPCPYPSPDSLPFACFNYLDSSPWCSYPSLSHPDHRVPHPSLSWFPARWPPQTLLFVSAVPLI